MQLGRRCAPVPANAPTFAAHAFAAQKAPPKLIRAHVPFQPAMDGNDTVGDCTWTGLANAIRAQAALSGFQVNIPTQMVLDAYAASSGWVPGNPATDKGEVEVDVLARQATLGFDGGAEVPYVGMWGTIDPGNLNLLRLVMVRLGMGYLGVNLALADQTTTVWDTETPASAGDPKPGSWGAHCLGLWDYEGVEDTHLVRLATWGKFQLATWRWVQSRMDEAHGIFHRQLFKTDGLNFAGLDFDRLANDNAAFNVAAMLA